MQLQHQKITLDVNDTRAFTVLNAHQGDSKTRFIDITLTENGNTITLSSNYVATVKASINSKTKAVNTAVVDATNNVITVELTKTMLDTPGLLNCEVILQDNQQFVTSATFTVKVAESVISDESEIVASQEFGKLLDALTEIKDIEDKADRVQKLVDNIDKLESADDIINRISASEANIKQNATDISTASTGYYNIHCDYKIGSIDKTTGEEKDGSAFITDKLDLSQYSTITITTDRPTLYASIFEYDSNNKFTKVIADTKNKITFSPIIGYKYIIWLWYGGTDFSKIADVTVIGKAINTIAENDTRYELARETCKLDLPDAFYIQKGGTLELFKYGMYYSNYEFVENKYNVRLVNLSDYTKEYSDKIVITCPADYADDILRKPSDLPLFQLLDRFGKVIDSKRVTFYVTDITKIVDRTRRIMYLGDSFTGMAVRSGETANLISQTTLTDTKLIGRSIGQGSGNKFTGTGGYSWANYTDNPNTLPSAYPNNYLWVESYNNISMSYFVKNTLNETQLDYLVILLGWNDYENGAFANKFNWSDLKMRAKKLIENTHIGFPNCKIILEGYHYMYPSNRKSYGNAMPQVRQNKYIYDLNKLYQEIANEYDYVTFVQMSCQIDVLHNMTMESAKVNKRSEKTVEYCKDCVHPANEGFYQYSDAEFTALTYLMTKES
jgi:hypothetical protein